MQMDATHHSIIPSIPKQVALFAHRHPFLEEIRGSFTKSERRKFERDVYDYAEALGMDHVAAKKQAIKARGFCGEEDYDSDNSALGGEIDDSSEILKRLAVTSGPGPDTIVPSTEDQQPTQIGIAKAKSSPKKSPYFAASNSTGSRKKRKADKIDQEGLEVADDSLKHGKNSKKRQHKRSSEASGVQGEVDHTGNSGADSNTNDILLLNTDARASQKTSKHARRSREKAELDTQYDSSQAGRADTLEPETDAEAHKIYPKPNQQVSKAHRQTLDQNKEEQAAHNQRDVILIENVSGDIDYEVERELDLYTHGDVQNENEHVKDDLGATKMEQGKLTHSSEKGHKSKEKRKKSDPAHREKKPKSRKRRQTEEDFRKPMIQ